MAMFPPIRFPLLDLLSTWCLLARLIAVNSPEYRYRVENCLTETTTIGIDSRWFGWLRVSGIDRNFVFSGNRRIKVWINRREFGSFDSASFRSLSVVVELSEVMKRGGTIGRIFFFRWRSKMWNGKRWLKYGWGVFSRYSNISPIVISVSIENCSFFKD